MQIAWILGNTSLASAPETSIPALVSEIRTWPDRSQVTIKLLVRTLPECINLTLFALDEPKLIDALEIDSKNSSRQVSATIVFVGVVVVVLFDVVIVFVIAIVSSLVRCQFDEFNPRFPYQFTVHLDKSKLHVFFSCKRNCLSIFQFNTARSKRTSVIERRTLK